MLPTLPKAICVYRELCGFSLVTSLSPGNAGRSSRVVALAKKKDGADDAPAVDSSPAAQGTLPILDLNAAKPAPSKPKERTAYRRKPLTEEQLRAQREQRARENAQAEEEYRRWSQEMREAEEGGTAGSRRGRGSKGKKKATGTRPPIALLDGYNLLHRDETLSRLASQTELAFARGQLETWVDAFAKEARTHCIIVYDAMMSRRQEVSWELKSPWLTVAFAGRSEADTLIVSKAWQAHEKGAERVYVITGDARIQMEVMTTDCDDSETIIALDPGSFLRDLKSVRSGDPAPAKLWRLTSSAGYSKHQQYPQYGSDSGGTTSDNDSDRGGSSGSTRRVQGGRASRAAAGNKEGNAGELVLDSEALEEKLLGIVERQDASSAPRSSRSSRGGLTTGHAKGRAKGEDDLYVQQALLFAGVEAGATRDGAQGSSSSSSDDEFELGDDEDIMALLKKKL